MHIFLDAGAGNILAFFELPNSPPMGRDPNTPDWTQHIAFQVEDIDTLLKAKERAEAAGLEVVGPTDHTIFKSIYIWDPSGHRVEVATWTATPPSSWRE
jgi:glyoxylase I family protein